MHEFGHAAGFLHEQSRVDRDDEAKILYGNIQETKEHNFIKRSLGYMLNYDNAPYDVSSVMHYSLTVSIELEVWVVRCLLLHASLLNHSFYF